MHLDQVYSQVTAQQINNLLVEYFNIEIPLVKLNKKRVRALRERTLRKLSDIRNSSSFHESQNNPTYLSLVILEGMLARWEKENFPLFEKEDIKSTESKICPDCKRKVGTKQVPLYKKKSKEYIDTHTDYLGHECSGAQKLPIVSKQKKKVVKESVDSSDPKAYGIRWTEWTGKNKMGSPKEFKKFFRTEKHLDNFVNSLEIKTGFKEILGYSHPEKITEDKKLAKKAIKKDTKCKTCKDDGWIACKNCKGEKCKKCFGDGWRNCPKCNLSGKNKVIDLDESMLVNEADSDDDSPYSLGKNLGQATRSAIGNGLNKAAYTTGNRLGKVATGVKPVAKSVGRGLGKAAVSTARGIGKATKASAPVVGRGLASTAHGLGKAAIGATELAGNAVSHGLNLAGHSINAARAGLKGQNVSEPWKIARSGGNNQQRNTGRTSNSPQAKSDRSNTDISRLTDAIRKTNMTNDQKKILTDMITIMVKTNPELAAKISSAVNGGNNNPQQVNQAHPVQAQSQVNTTQQPVSSNNYRLKVTGDVGSALRNQGYSGQAAKDAVAKALTNIKFTGDLDKDVDELFRQAQNFK